ncbi:Oidioi.mRNA.OKI2018_I69.chr2.g6528.t1.cds [Oikopleura dioica]|uniref:Oidioi.mRNA.OKI2018_I69.chr2.g6528.t1.cds n=1 Tax=Oikopleura dioica TaxID=34765 RepID=A0ABN7T9W7_OIKDI|nr:Oidioi.mRNA.OKI2018_I69.chr2.g6528.t1.cds [Oikopleura dioica]
MALAGLSSSSRMWWKLVISEYDSYRKKSSWNPCCCWWKIAVFRKPSTKKHRKHFPHPEYNLRSQHNDIAILKVSTPFSINTFVRPVCLPCHSRPLPDKAKCIVTGFGLTERGRTTEDKIFASVETHSKEFCSSRFGYGFKDGMMCAGGRTADTCRGDSGGPLVCSINGHYYIFGITSWGQNPNCQGGQGVYTSVPSYLEWIHQNF